MKKVAIVILTLTILILILINFRAVSGNSMEPTLKHGQVVRVYRDTPQRGSIIVFTQEGMVYVKRVIGLPYDTITFQNGRVYVNTVDQGDALHSEYRIYVVKPDTYFVMGDNRETSIDSSTFGLVPKSSVIGLVKEESVKNV